MVTVLGVALFVLVACAIDTYLSLRKLVQQAEQTNHYLKQAVTSLDRLQYELHWIREFELPQFKPHASPEVGGEAPDSTETERR